MDISSFISRKIVVIQNFPSWLLIKTGGRFLRKSFNESIMGWSRSTNEGWYLFVVVWFRDYTEFFDNIGEDIAHNNLMLIVKVEESKCHLDKEVFVSTNHVARCIDIWGKKIAHVLVVRRFRRAYTSFVSVSHSIWSRIVVESYVSSNRLIAFNFPSIFPHIAS